MRILLLMAAILSTALSVALASEAHSTLESGLWILAALVCLGWIVSETRSLPPSDEPFDPY